jgi:periplasmic protein TonB
VEGRVVGRVRGLTAGEGAIGNNCLAGRLRKHGPVRGRDMNLQQFTLPATIAAACHAALLMSGIPGTRIVTVPPQVVIFEPTPPVDISEPPPAEEDPVVEFKPLGGGPARVEIPDVLVVADGPFVIDAVKPDTELLKVDMARVLPPGGGGDGPGVWTPGTEGFTTTRELDSVPRATVQMAPEYPASMRQEKADGTVTVEFDVDARGRVVSARIKHSSHRAFEAPTIRAVLKWRFEPGQRKGIAVPFRMAIPVNFKFGQN